jgi:hypothetical protein
VNLFYGMPMKPDPEKSCAEILELLLYLCGDEEAVFEWVLKWIAYPLQHPGAKMQTAIVMHGEEGAGKNLFWEVVRTIYGPYGSVITQNELESQFNTWATRKLFMIANEVVSRSELREHKGRLKNYITEKELQINEKLLPLRTEENHMNFVFLSNETQPLALDRTDRRYLVLWTPPAKPPDFYAKVGAELEGGGAAALYAYLMALDLADFSPHAKPIMTQAKRNLIEISKISRSCSSTSGARASCACHSCRQRRTTCTARFSSGAASTARSIRPRRPSLARTCGAWACRPIVSVWPAAGVTRSRCTWCRLRRTRSTGVNRSIAWCGTSRNRSISGGGAICSVHTVHARVHSVSR